jgi:hypothetical protein
MRLADVSRLAAQLDGVAERRCGDLLDWRYRGRLVARQRDGSHIVIRASFELPRFPDPFVPRDVLGAEALREAHDDRGRPREMGIQMS